MPMMWKESPADQRGWSGIAVVVMGALIFALGAAAIGAAVSGFMQNHTPQIMVAR